MKGGRKDIYKTVDEIRHLLGITQTQMSELLGVCLRAYQKKINTNYWTIDELIKASKLNNGKLIVNTSDGSYKLDIKEIN